MGDAEIACNLGLRLARRDPTRNGRTLVRRQPPVAAAEWPTAARLEPSSLQERAERAELLVDGGGVRQVRAGGRDVLVRGRRDAAVRVSPLLDRKHARIGSPDRGVRSGAGTAPVLSPLDGQRVIGTNAHAAIGARRRVDGPLAAPVAAPLSWPPATTARGDWMATPLAPRTLLVRWGRRNRTRNARPNLKIVFKRAHCRRPLD